MIKKLKDLRKYEDPLKKARQIQEARDLIPICINEFWRGIDVPAEKLILDADQMRPIAHCDLELSLPLGFHGNFQAR